MLTLAQRQCNGNRHDNPTGWKCTCGGGQAYHNNATPTNNASNPEGTPFDGWRPNLRSSSASAPNPHPIERDVTATAFGVGRFVTGEANNNNAPNNSASFDGWKKG